MIYRVGPKYIWKRHAIEEENKLIDIHAATEVVWEWDFVGLWFVIRNWGVLRRPHYACFPIGHICC
jgi:hypothetical protein